MEKFFVNPEDVLENTILIKGTDVNHIKNVLRLPLGKEILINNRQGTDYKCIIRLIDSHIIETEIIDVLEQSSEPFVKTVLFQALVKGEKMEFVIQKAVEIGVTIIVPIITDRCVVKLDTEKKIKGKCERWQKISESAAKQSKRSIVPEVKFPMTFREALQYAKDNCETSCIPFENEKSNYIKDYLRQSCVNSIGIFIGPEGGFTDKEIEEADSYETKSVTLGRRILRSETAGLVTLANIMYEMGES